MDNLKSLFESNRYYEGNGRIILRDIRPRYYSYYDERLIYEFADFVEDSMYKIATPEARFVFHTIGEICEHMVQGEPRNVDGEIIECVECNAALYGVKFRNVGLGQKITRLVRKLCEVVELEKDPSWDRYYAAFCEHVNYITVHKTIVFSVNESDMELAKRSWGWIPDDCNTAMFVLDSFNGTLDCMPYAVLCVNAKELGATLRDSFVMEMLALAFQQQ